MDRENDFLTVKELSAILKLSPSTIRNYMRQGKIPTIRFSHRTYRGRIPADAQEQSEGNA